MDFTVSQPYAECPVCLNNAGLSPVEINGVAHYVYFCRKCKCDFLTQELQEEINKSCSTQEVTEKKESQKT